MHPTLVLCVAVVLASPIDESTLTRIRIWPLNLKANPGSTVQLGIADPQFGDEPTVKPDSVVWSITPATGVKIDPATGALEISKDVPVGSTVEITANVENGRRQLHGKMTIYKPVESALVGTWKEEQERDCHDQKWRQAKNPIQELTFSDDGSFSCTWHPFESYKDYWGTYRHDSKSGDVELTVKGGNTIPKDLVNKGKASIKDGKLEFDGVWLGTPASAKASGPTHGCGHRFTIR